MTHDMQYNKRTRVRARVWTRAVRRERERTRAARVGGQARG